MVADVVSATASVEDVVASGEDVVASLEDDVVSVVSAAVVGCGGGEGVLVVGAGGVVVVGVVIGAAVVKGFITSHGQVFLSPAALVTIHFWLLM